MKLIIDISDEEYKTLSKMSEKEKVNELSYYERIIANGKPVYEHERLKSEWQETDKLWETNCSGGMGYDYGYYFKCPICNNTVVDKTNFCPQCGAEMKGEEG